METKHTQGRWYIGVRRNNIFSTDNSSNLKISVQCDNSEELQYNAKLIAAAPELLEALMIAHDIIALRHAERPELIQIKNAIKKATE